jgi:hypothetical protein
LERSEYQAVLLPRGQCYENYFRRFLPIIVEKNDFFLENSIAVILFMPS